MTQAKIENRFLVSTFVLILFGVGLIQAGIELISGERPQVINLFLQTPSKTNLKAVEKDLEKSNWLSQATQPWMRYIQFFLLHDTGDKALLGRNGWFFYRPGVQYAIEPWPAPSQAATNLREVAAAILHFRDQLAIRNIHLLLMPAPDKESIYPEMLTSRAKMSNESIHTHTLQVMNELKNAGLEILDLFNLYKQLRQQTKENYYLIQDTHWSPAGMRAAAHAAMQKLIDRDWVKPGTVEYEMKSIPFIRYGDVLRMMNLPLYERHFSPEPISSTQVIRKDTSEPYRDDPLSEILVLGDSFLRIYERDEPKSGGFVAHLAYELKTPVTSIINDGGASTLVRQELARKPALLQNKKVAIWEFVERDLRFGTEGWQKIPLPR